MMFLSVFILALIYQDVNSTPVLTEEERSFWSAYAQLFPHDMGGVVRSESSLVQIHWHTSLTKNYDLDAIMLGCSNYSSGDALATKVREDEKLSVELKVLSVSPDDDAMCFMTLDPQLKSSGLMSTYLQFYYPLPPPFKLHSTVYNLLERTNDESTANYDEEDITIYYHQDYFQLTNKISFTHFEEVLVSLLDYQSTPLENFFWSSESTNQFYSERKGEVSNDVRVDSDRAYDWAIAAHLFQSEKARWMREDSCDFKSILLSATILDDKIVIPCSSLVYDSKENVSIKSCLAHLLATLSLDSAVNYIAITKRVELFNFRARSVDQSAVGGASSQSTTPYSIQGLLGANQIVAIADTGVDVTSCYFSDPSGKVVAPSDISSPKTDTSVRKVVQYTYCMNKQCNSDTSDKSAGHGTHVSGTAVGSILGADLSTNGTYGGVAPSGKLAFMDLSSSGNGIAVPNAATLFGAGYSAGARVFTYSWGSYYNGAGYYAGSGYDTYLFNNMDTTAFFAAGNSGNNGASTVSIEGSAKNVLTVGSCQSAYPIVGSNGQSTSYVSWFSSMGPTYDKRIKPELVAPGDPLMSARSNGLSGPSCSTVEKLGTSMASPAAAGAALLVRQYFMDSGGAFWSGQCNSAYRNCRSFSPSGVLVKAILLHSGTRMTMYAARVPLGPPPDSTQGYGRVTLKNVLPLRNVYVFDLFVDDLVTIAAFSTVTYSIKLGPYAVSLPIKVTLSWFDPPGVNGNTGPSLINNLDLTVTSPGNTIYYGNGLNQPDVLNNNEQVYISQPTAGIWTVTVSARSLPVSGSQRFSIVITSAGPVLYGRP